MPGRHFSHFCCANETPSSSRIKGEQHRSLSCHFHLCRGGCAAAGAATLTPPRPGRRRLSKQRTRFRFTSLSLSLSIWVTPKSRSLPSPQPFSFFSRNVLACTRPRGRRQRTQNKEDRERKQKYFDGPPAGSRLMNREVNSFLLSRNDKSFFIFFVQGKKRP